MSATLHLTDRVKLDLMRLIEADGLKPGDKLPPEREFAAELGVSRPAVREAFKTLEISGLLELRTGVKGSAFIRPGNVDVLTRSLRDLVSVGRVSMRSLAETRSLIHDVVIRLACERGREADFKALEANLRQLDEYAAAGDLKSRAEAAVDFFSLIARATRNEALEVLVNSLANIIRVSVLDRSRPSYRAELVPVRYRIVEHLRARDAKKASEEMAHYLEIVHRSLLKNPKLATTRIGLETETVPARTRAPARKARSKPAA